MAAIIFPPNPAGQTPVNTFSTTSTPLANTANTFTYTWNGTAWTSAPAGGGGGGTVTGVTGTLPITVATGTTTPVIAINAATAAAAGSIEIATLAEAATGTDATRASTPQTAVPKDASGMTGAALLPGGTQVQRPGTPAAGMIRYNTNTYGADTVYEVYDPVIPGWRPIQYGVSLGVLTSYTATNGATLPASGTYENITIPAGVTVYVDGLSSLRARTSIVVDGTLVGTGRGYVGGAAGTTWQLPNTSDYLATVGIPGAGAGRGLGNGGLANAGIAYGFNLLLGSSGGSGAVTTYGGAGPATGAGAGGAGGASITFVCDGTITVGASAIINMNGTTPAAPFVQNNAQVGGGGGGSGGLILLQAAQSLTLGAALLDVSGGQGGPGAIAGPSVTGYLGGGGGGGGYVVFNSPNLTNSASINLNGGGAGPVAGVADYANGGGGGGFGGAGGAGGQNLGGGPYNAPTAGANGQILTNTYI